MVEFESTDLSASERARIIKTAVSPRPIAWISTVSDEGTDNLAPFSSYNYVGSRQPVVLFNTRNRTDGPLKDTARNVLDTGEFAVNIVTEEQLERMDHTAESIPPDESEFDLADVEDAACTRISPSRVADSPVTMECTLFDSIAIHDRLMIIGEVEHFHVSESLLTDGEIDSRHVDTVGRLGGPYYTISEPVEFERRY